MKIPQPSEGGNREPIPAGTYIGICYRFIDMGTQKTDFKGTIKFVRRIMLSWILPDELMSDGKPFSAHKQYGWSMHEKATLRHDLESWRGKAFSTEEFGSFDTKNLLGKPCMLTITESVKPDGAIYSNITSVGKPMKGMVIPKLDEPTVYFTLEPEGFDSAVYETFSDSLKQKIAQSPEYVALQKGSAAAPAPAHNGLNAGFDPDDQIPF